MTVQGRTATSTITNRVQTRPSLNGHSRHSRSCYSITRSARSRTDWGIRIASSRAVLRFTTKSNWVGSTTGSRGGWWHLCSFVREARAAFEPVHGRWSGMAQSAVTGQSAAQLRLDIPIFNGPARCRVLRSVPSPPLFRATPWAPRGLTLAKNGFIQAAW